MCGWCALRTAQHKQFYFIRLHYWLLGINRIGLYCFSSYRLFPTPLANTVGAEPAAIFCNYQGAYSVYG
jgi:hypothetical protein